MVQIVPDLAAQADVYSADDGSAPVAPAEDQQQAPAAAPSAGAQDLRRELGIATASGNGASVPDATRVAALRHELGIGDAGPRRPVPGAGANRQPATNQTRFQTAGTHAPAGAPEQDWGDTLGTAAKNFLPSVGGQVASLYNAVRHPLDTGNALSQLGQGAYSQIIGALGAKQDPAEKAKAEALINALEGHYRNVYGGILSGDFSGFKKALAEDPASILMDFSTVFGGAAGIAGKVADAGGMAARVAGAAGKAASAIDPLAMGAKLAGKAASATVAPALRGASSVVSGISPYLQKVAYTAGLTSNSALRDAYQKFASGMGDPAEYVQRVRDAAKAARDEQSANYVAQKAGLADRQIDMQGVLDHLDSADNELQRGAAGGWEDAKDAAQKVRSLVEDVATNPKSGSLSLENVDALKQQIHDLRGQYQSGRAKAYIDQAYAAVRKTLADPARGGDEGYAALMDNWMTTKSGIDDAEKMLAGGSRVAASNAMAKALRSTKTGTGQSVLDTLAKHDPTIPFMIAGHAMNAAHGSVTLGEGLLGSLLYHVNPAATVGAAVVRSPRLTGLANYTAGRVGSAIDSVAGTPLGKGAVYAGRAEEEQQNPSNPMSDGAPPSASLGASRADRNNNLGNLRASPWTRAQPGYAGTDKDGFAMFDKPESGRAAAAALLRSKLSSGLTTPSLLINHKNGWDHDAPPSYAQRVADHLGIGVHDQIDTSDPRSVQKIMEAIYEDEGNHPHTGSAFGGARVARAAGGRIGSPEHERLVDRLMKLAVSAKKASDETTEPLLNASDAHIVKALKIAQREI